MLKVGFDRITESVSHVDSRGRSLENTKSSYHGRRHSILWLIDLEILKRSLCLSPPVFVRGDLDLSKGITFCSGRL